jgi:hypothetical protein
MPQIKIDLQALSATLMAAVLVAVIAGGFSAYVNLAVLTESVDQLKVEVIKLRQTAHTHGTEARMYLPDATPGD